MKRKNGKQFTRSPGGVSGNFDPSWQGTHGAPSCGQNSVATMQSWGSNLPADRACAIALALSPTSRYLLRSSACFFTSVGEPDRAWALLERAPNTRSDPWLASAHIAAARQAGRPLRGIKKARLLMEDANFSPRDQPSSPVNSALSKWNRMNGEPESSFTGP